MNLLPLPPDRIQAVYLVFTHDKPYFDNQSASADENEIKDKKARTIYQAATRRRLSEQDVGNYLRLFVGSPQAAKYILPRAFEFWPVFYHEIISMIVHRDFSSWEDSERKVVLEQLQYGLNHKATASGHFRDQVAESSWTENAKDNLIVGKNEDQLFAEDPDLALVLCENFHLK